MGISYPMPEGPDLHVHNGAGARPFTYVLPLAAGRPLVDPEFVAYLHHIATQAELVVVDGSPAEVFAEHEHRWGSCCRHVAPAERTPMGKVGNVMTGLRLAAHERVVIADDDIRFGPELVDLVARLDGAEVVRPQNFFDPLPWHAVWDSGRSLLNRLTGGDWPGTLAVRRSPLLDAGGYAGDVMFENYELARTVEAAGGRHVCAPDLFVRRRPPSTRQFLNQRVRQAYDELARPARLAAFLPVVPAAVALVAARRWAVLRRSAVAGAVLVAAAAEVGRRRNGAREWFPARCSLAAPAWVAERSVCVWLALLARARGGVRYRGQRLPRAALSPAERRARMTGPPLAACGR